MEYGYHVDGFFAVGYAVYFLVVGFWEGVVGGVGDFDVSSSVG
jgi:hypothetical protein